MKLLAHNTFTKFIFIFFRIFFIIRTTSYIDIKKNIYQFNINNWFNFSFDILSILALIILIIYLLYFISTSKKFPIILILDFKHHDYNKFIGSEEQKNIIVNMNK